MKIRQRTTAVPAVELAAMAHCPSRFGEFQFAAFRTSTGLELGAMIRGDVMGSEGVPVRLHSACFTGDLMGSLRCDCREQLEVSLRWLGRAARGALLYLPQEGRGIGLVNKIKAYRLQEDGLDTVEANEALGFEDDLRSYELAAEMIRLLEIPSVCLLTNNPRKVEGLREHGVRVVGCIPMRIPASDHNRRYLRTKREKSGHAL